jgi:hypothetical protein
VTDGAALLDTPKPDGPPKETARRARDVARQLAHQPVARSARFVLSAAAMGSVVTGAGFE